MSDELIKYLAQVKRTGGSVADARKILLGSGWSPEDVDAAIKLIPGGPASAPHPEKSGQRAGAFAVVVVAAVGVIGAGAFAVYQFARQPFPAQPIPPQAVASPAVPVSQPSPVPVVSPIPAAQNSGRQDGAWISYRLDLAGFGLEYPPGWSLYLNELDISLTNEMLMLQKGVVSDSFKTFADSAAAKDFVTIEFSLQGESSGTSQEIIRNGQPAVEENSNEGPTTLGGKPAYYRKVRGFDGGGTLRIATTQNIAAVASEVAYVVTVKAGNIDNPLIGEILSKVLIYEPQLGEIQKVALENARKKARDAKRIADVRQLQTAYELYYNDRNRYPVGSQISMGTGGAACLDERGFGGSGGCSAPIYMSLIPRNPDPGGSEYVYTRLTDTSFNLTFSLEVDAGGLKAGENCATENGLESKPCAAVERNNFSQPNRYRY